MELAKVLLREWHYSAARKELEAVVSMESRRSEAHGLLGIALIAEGECGLASVELETAESLGWADEDVEFHLGYAHLLCGRREEAIARFRRYLERHPMGRYAGMARRYVLILKRRLLQPDRD